MTQPSDDGPWLISLQSFVELGIKQARGQNFPWKTVRACLWPRGGGSSSQGECQEKPYLPNHLSTICNLAGAISM